MAFLSGWFKPTCEGCKTKIEGDPIAHGGRKLCSACHVKAVEAVAVKAAELQARRELEEEARARLDASSTYGGDARRVRRP